jgi:hypothetical protein
MIMQNDCQHPNFPRLSNHSAKAAITQSDNALTNTEANEHATDATALGQQLDKWVEEEMFEEDVRAVLRMMRPHRQEKLQGWKEYRTGGRHFRVTVSWDDQHDHPTDELSIPHLADVLETLLVGSAKAQDELTAEQEFHAYRKVILDVLQRLQERQSCYE